MAEIKFIISVVDRATAGIVQIQKSMGVLTNGFNNVRQSILGVQSAAALFVTGWVARSLRDFATEFTRTAASFEAMQMRFKALGAPDYTKDVMAFATKNPLVGLEATQKAFVQLYAAGINPTSGALQNLADAVAVFGGSTEDMNKALVAIQQMAGKGCHARGTLIRMFDGSERKVENVKVGDALMGPDGVGRNVLVCAHGREDMFKVVPVCGEPFIVNHGHIMRVIDSDGIQRNLLMSQYLLMSPIERNAYSLVHINGTVTFKVEPVGVDDFFGFLLDGDHLYLDAQGFVHHNTVNMEELRQQLGERIPGAINIMAREMGYGEAKIGDFFKRIETGKVSSREGLTALFTGLEKDFSGASEKMKGTWSGLVASITLEWEMFKKDFMDAETFEKVKNLVRDIFRLFTDNRDTIKEVLSMILSYIVELGKALAVVVNLLVQAINLIKYMGAPVKGAIEGVLGEISGLTGSTLSAVAGNQTSALAVQMRDAGEWFSSFSKNLLAAQQKTLDPKNLDALFDSLEASSKRLNSAMWGVGADGKPSSINPSSANSATAGKTSNGYFLKDIEKKPFWSAAESPQSILEKLKESNKMFELDMEARRAQLNIQGGTTTPFVPGTFSEGFKAELQKMEEDFNETFGNMAKMGKESAKIVADAMAGAFNDFFIDAIEGRLQQFKDYLLSFFTSIGRAISQALSQYLAMQALGYMMPGAFGGAGGGGMPARTGADAAGMGGMWRPKAGGSTPTIQIVNNSGVPMEGTASYSTNDMGDTVMTVVMDAVGRNKGGSRDALRAMLAG